VARRVEYSDLTIGAVMRPVGHSNEDVSVRKGARASALSAAVFVVGAVAVALMLVATTADDGSAQSQPDELNTPDADSSLDTSDAVDQTATTEDSVAGPEDGAIVEAGSNNNVSVQVANTTSVRGAAATLTDALKTQGYLTLNPTNASSGSLATTKIHYAAGMLLEARALAEFLELDVETSVFVMPTDPASDVANFLDPRILVLIGSDLAA